MNRLGTLCPPAAISYFTPASDGASLTNRWNGVSLVEQRIQSAFESASKELERYKEYQARWDGYFALPFEEAVLNDASQILHLSAAAFLDTRTIPTFVTTGPASDGSIDVELSVGERRVLMTLYPHDENLRLSWFNRSDAKDETEPMGTESVERWLDWLRSSRSLPPVLAANPENP